MYLYSVGIMVGSDDDECHSVTEYVEAKTPTEAIALVLTAHKDLNEKAIISVELEAERVLRAGRLKGN